MVLFLSSLCLSLSFQVNSAVVPTKVLSDPMELERTLQAGLTQSAAAVTSSFPFDQVSQIAAAAVVATNGGYNGAAAATAIVAGTETTTAQFRNLAPSDSTACSSVLSPTAPQSASAPAAKLSTVPIAVPSNLGFPSSATESAPDHPAEPAPSTVAVAAATTTGASSPSSLSTSFSQPRVFLSGTSEDAKIPPNPTSSLKQHIVPVPPSSSPHSQVKDVVAESSQSPVQVDVHHHVHQVDNRQLMMRHVQTMESVGTELNRLHSDDEEEKENMARTRTKNNGEVKTEVTEENLSSAMAATAVSAATALQHLPPSLSSSQQQQRRKGKSSSLRRSESGGLQQQQQQQQQKRQEQKAALTRKASMPTTSMSLIVSSSQQQPLPPPGSSSMSTTSFSSRDNSPPTGTSRSGSSRKRLRNGRGGDVLSSSDADVEAGSGHLPKPEQVNDGGQNQLGLKLFMSRCSRLQDLMLPEKEEYKIELRKDERRGLGITVAGYVCEKGAYVR
jgi:hypothetical protein